ncbi:carbohydrate ABC transporter permease [Mollicutes bacterium LVI A0039]|nr:carbohydrate ABC transporter permease [Mollicutes bacterium LVI A0039]
MNKKTTLSIKLVYLALIIGSLAMVLPFIWLIASTFKIDAEIVGGNPTFFPSQPTIENYINMITQFNIGRYFFNSVFLSTVRTFIGVYTSLLCGYALAKFDFKFKNQVYAFILITMMVPSFTTLIPMYNMVNQWGLNDSYLAIILPTLLSSFGIFMMRQYMIDGVPNELIEAAKIDGAGEFYIFHKIVVPQCVNMISALSIFLFLWNWEDFLWPYLVLSSESKFPLAVALSQFTGQNVTHYGQLFAATAVTIIPVIIVYLSFQKRFVEGVSMSGIK